MTRLIDPNKHCFDRIKDHAKKRIQLLYTASNYVITTESLHGFYKHFGRSCYIYQRKRYLPMCSKFKTGTITWNWLNITVEIESDQYNISWDNKDYRIIQLYDWLMLKSLCRFSPWRMQLNFPILELKYTIGRRLIILTTIIFKLSAGKIHN